MKLIIALVRIVAFAFGFTQGFFAGLFGRRARVTHTFAAVVPSTKLLRYEERRS